MNSIEAPSVQLKSRSEVAPMHLTKKDHLPLETKNRENVGNDRKADSTSGNDRLHHIRRYESSSLPTTRSRPSSAPLVLPIKGDFNSRALRQRDKLHLSDKNDGAENDRRVRRLKVMALEEAIQSREVDRSTVSNVTRISHLPLSKSAESTDHIERNAKPPVCGNRRYGKPYATTKTRQHIGGPEHASPGLIVPDVQHWSLNDREEGGKLALLRQKLNSRRRRYRANLEADGPYEAPTRSHREENDRTSTTVECVTSGRSRLALDGDEKKSCQRGMKAKQGSAASNVRRKMRNEDFNAQSNAKSCSSSFSNPDNAHTADVAFPGRSRNTSLNKDISASGRTVETKMRHHVHPPEGDNSVKAHEQYSRRDKQREQKKTSTSSARSSRPESFVSRTKTGGDYLGQPEEAMIANAVVDYGAIQPGEVEKIDVIHCSACDKSFAPPTFEKLCNAFDKNGERKCVKMYNAKRKIYNAAKIRIERNTNLDEKEKRLVMAGRRQVVNELRSSSSSTSNGSSAKTLGAAKRSSWRDKSQQFREAMKYCRET